MDFKVGDRVKIIASENNLICSGCDDSINPGEIHTIKEMDTDSVRLGPEDTCSWVAKHHVEKVDSKGQASTIDLIKTFNVGDIISFTMNHKNLEIAFEDGMIKVRDWSGRGDPVEYTVDTIEQLEELMGAWESVCRFKSGD